MAEKKVDALILPIGKFRKTGKAKTVLDGYLDYAEPILGGKGYVRNQGSFAFVTCSPHCTLLYPIGHSLEKQPRYDWVDQEDGAKFGYLKDDPGGEAESA